MPSPRSNSQRFAEWLVDWRWPLLALAAAFTAAAWFPARRLEFDRSVENMFAPDDPLLVPYRQLKRTFGGNEIVIAAYRDENLLSQRGLARVADLTRRLGQVDGVAHVGGRPAVMSLSRFPLGIGLDDERLLEMASGFFISSDRRTAAVVVLLDSTRGSMVQERAVADIRRAVESHDAGGVIAGEPVMVAEGFRLLEEDGRRLGLICTVLLVATIALCFRSMRWVAIPLLVVNVTLIVTEGLLVASGMKLSMVSSMLWAIVTVVGVATVIHVIVHFRALRATGGPRRGALVATAAALGVPIIWTCLTDAIGFGALLFASVGPIQDFGVMMTCGAALVLLFVPLIVPALALWGRFDADPKTAWGEHVLSGVLNRTLDFVLRKPKTFVVVTLLSAGLVSAGAARLVVETDFTSNFRAGSQIVTSYNLVEEELGGVGAWDVIVPAPAELNAEFLDRLRALQTRLRAEVRVQDDNGEQRPGLTKVFSLADVLDAGPGTEVFGRPLVALAWEFFRRRMQMDLSLPRDWQALLVRANQGEVRLKLAFVRAALPDVYALLFGEDPQQPGKNFARIMLRSRERQSAEQKQRLIDDARRIAAQEFPAEDAREAAEITGFFVLLANLIQSMIRDQWITLGVATGAILLMVWFAFRSLRLALAALIPNLLPVLMISGVMGWLNVKINMGSAMIAAVSMGLAIDSSIHYVLAYQRLRATGRGVREALSTVQQDVGLAVTFSTLSLVVGFSALCFSEFVPLVYFGVLVSFAMLGGMAGNLVLLPVLVFLAEQRWLEEGLQEPHSNVHP